MNKKGIIKMKTVEEVLSPAHVTMVVVKRMEEKELVEDRFMIRKEFEAENQLRETVKAFLKSDEGIFELERRNGTFQWRDVMNVIPLYFWNLHGIIPVINDGFSFNGEHIEISLGEENLAE